MTGFGDFAGKPFQKQVLTSILHGYDGLDHRYNILTALPTPSRRHKKKKYSTYTKKLGPGADDDGVVDAKYIRQITIPRHIQRPILWDLHRILLLTSSSLSCTDRLKGS